MYVKEVRKFHFNNFTDAYKMTSQKINGSTEYSFCSARDPEV